MNIHILILVNKTKENKIETPPTMPRFLLNKTSSTNHNINWQTQILTKAVNLFAILELDEVSIKS